MKTAKEIKNDLNQILAERIVLLDGAMGTEIQNRELDPEDFGGPDLDGCNENLVRTRPDVIKDIHTSYYEAGSDIVVTNTFGSSPIVLEEYGLQDDAYEISKKAAELAVELAKEVDSSGSPRFVAGSMGPTTKTITVTGGVTFEELIDSYYEQARGLVDGGVDLLLLETCQDTRNVKSALIGINQYFKESGIKRPIMVSGTIEPMGTMLAGQTVESLYTSLEHADLFSFGLNCATGPEFMTDHIRSASEISPVPTSCYPNAGMPNEEGEYNETPEMMAETLERFVDNQWINILGGCCGTTPEYLKMFREMTENKEVRVPEGREGTHVSGIEPLEMTDDNRPVLIGETTNVLGSKQFKELINDEKYEEAAEMGRDQVRAGAQILDVCLQDPDREEVRDMEKFLDILIKKVKVPLMLDSTDVEVLKRGLTYCQGKAIINSINLEDGEERFEEVVPLLKKFGAAVVVGCIDEDPEQGMAVTVERKMEVADRSIDLLTNKYGLKQEDLIFDLLVFPAGTGDENYRGAARATVDGIEKLKEKYPKVKTTLGISNVSFGLPTAGREVLNSVMLYDATKAGLDTAIVNTKRIIRYSQLSDEEKELSRNLLYRGTDEDIEVFADYFRDADRREEDDNMEDMSLDERLGHYILIGSKQGLDEDLDQALEEYDEPLDIINGPLMDGMSEVGRLFNDNELIVAEVLQSAEAMKAAVAHLEPHMDAKDSASKGTVMLATVKGDVHDIGKNLVEIIMTNNGYDVVNLGIKVTPEKLIEGFEEHEPDIIGLSGLLVKSAQQMVTTAEDFENAGIDVPLMVGGAALSNKFTMKKISPAYDNPVIYAKDAMNGLDLADQIIDREKREMLYETVREKMKAGEDRAASSNGSDSQEVDIPDRSPDIDRDHEVMRPPDLKRHLIEDYHLDEIFDYINPNMLYKKHLGFRGDLDGAMENGSDREQDIFQAVEELKKECVSGLMEANGVYKFFPCGSEGNQIHILDGPDSSKIIETFEFPRATKGSYLCLSDFVRDMDKDGVDYIGMFVVGCGQNVMERSEELKEDGQYLKSHALQALALESAEGFAELLHEKMRAMWNIRDDDLSMKEIFKARYRGIRVSFGYPACPDLEAQAKLFDLLEPEEIGVELTDGYMMEPEASVSAMAFHHPQAKYFSAL